MMHNITDFGFTERSCPHLRLYDVWAVWWIFSLARIKNVDITGVTGHLVTSTWSQLISGYPMVSRDQPMVRMVTIISSQHCCPLLTSNNTALLSSAAAVVPCPHTETTPVTTPATGPGHTGATLHCTAAVAMLPCVHWRQVLCVSATQQQHPTSQLHSTSLRERWDQERFCVYNYIMRETVESREMLTFPTNKMTYVRNVAILKWDTA